MKKKIKKKKKTVLINKIRKKKNGFSCRISQARTTNLTNMINNTINSVFNSCTQSISTKNNTFNAYGVSNVVFNGTQQQFVSVL